MIRFACPGCSATFTVTDEKAGKTGKCPKCQTQFTIPDVLAPAPEIPPPIPPFLTPVPQAPPPLPSHQPTESPPPMTAVAPGPNDPVEILPCPKCTSRLSVLPTDVGLDVECPNCQTVYRAHRTDAPPPPVLESSRGKPKDTALVKYGSGGKKSRDDDEDDDDDRPSRRKKKRRRDEDDEEDDDYDRPRRRSRGGRSRRRSYEPHRGVLILILAVISWVSGIFILGIIAWVLGAADMKSINSGRMDPEGKAMTQIGMYLGMAHCIIVIVAILGYCVIVGCIIGVGAGGR